MTDEASKAISESLGAAIEFIDVFGGGPLGRAVISDLLRVRACLGRCDPSSRLDQWSQAYSTASFNSLSAAIEFMESIQKAPNVRAIVLARLRDARGLVELKPIAENGDP